MVMTDPIADLLTRIRNANMVRHEKLEVPGSKIKKDIADILKREGFVRDVDLEVYAVPFSWLVVQRGE